MLRDEGLCAFKPSRTFIIKPVNKEKRIKWCEERKNWNLNNWKKIVFTDESLICTRKFQFQWVRRYQGEILSE